MFNYLNVLIFRFLKRYFSQDGEDKVLEDIFKDRKRGFYVDVGAHHPFRFSNTYLFHKKGWRGINIDATPGSMELFKKYRPSDINLEIPISNASKKIKYYIFDEPALNSFSSNLSNDRNTNTKFKIKKIIKLIPKKLSEVLDKYLPLKKVIDFMTIDVEGYEYEVLKSNNWKKFRPTYLLIEVLNYDSIKAHSDKILIFMTNQNYKLIDTVGRTSMFKRIK